MSSNSGIKKLAEAEDLANRKIKEAKEKRAQRIQEAKRSAEQKLQKIRAKFQAEFDQQEAQSLGGTKEEITKELATQTDREVATMKSEFAANKAKVADMLVDVVLKVQMDLHETLKKDSVFVR
jgi:V-type H+-transporting ATPase subunit G